MNEELKKALNLMEYEKLGEDDHTVASLAKELSINTDSAYRLLASAVERGTMTAHTGMIDGKKKKFYRLIRNKKTAK